MGGGYYSQDVAAESRSSNENVFSYQGYANDASQAVERREAHPKLNILGKERECKNQTPVVVALDVTRSRGNDSRIMYEKLPLFIGQIELKGYIEGAGISFAAIGDATVDQAPLQIGQFEADNRLDEVLSLFWLEEGGGGTGQESYELAAYYYARHTKLTAFTERGEKGYFFFVGDEGFYPKVNKDLVKEFIGDDLPEDISSEKIFEELQQKFHVFFVYPKKSWEERKSDIDAEIQQRVEAAGGQYKNVDVRASLLWNNRNDLDLHIIPPSGEEIYYAHKQSACGGWLDVDMNVQGETTKPVENVRWARGTAPKGRYKIIVQNYRFHEHVHPTPFKVEVEVNGEIKHFTGTVSPHGEIGAHSNVLVYEFVYDPTSRRSVTEEAIQYANYDDSVIRAQWSSVLPEENILIIDDPHAIIDVLLGALAIKSGSSDLENFIVDLRGMQNGEERIDQATRALENLAAKTNAVVKVNMNKLPAKTEGKERKSATKRL